MNRCLQFHHILACACLLLVSLDPHPASAGEGSESGRKPVLLYVGVKADQIDVLHGTGRHTIAAATPERLQSYLERLSHRCVERGYAPHFRILVHPGGAERARRVWEWLYRADAFRRPEHPAFPYLSGRPGAKDALPWDQKMDAEAYQLVEVRPDGMLQRIDLERMRSAVNVRLEEMRDRALSDGAFDQKKFLAEVKELDLILSGYHVDMPHLLLGQYSLIHASELEAPPGEGAGRSLMTVNEIVELAIQEEQGVVAIVRDTRPSFYAFFRLLDACRQSSVPFGFHVIGANEPMKLGAGGAVPR